MKHILLPTDFSDNSWNAIVYAIDFYDQMDCHFYLLHVDRPIPTNMSPSTYGVAADYINEDYITRFKAPLKHLMHRIAKEFPENKYHKFFSLLDSGPFVDTIRRHVKERNIETIVMGTKGATGLKKLLLGSNAGDVITKVKCTTLIVPENAKFKTVDEIAFPTDYSLTYETGHLQPIAEILERYHASLSILHITKNAEKLTETQRRNKDFLEEYFAQQLMSFHHIKNANIENAIQNFVESRTISMIAMVAKNLNYSQQILFHSKIKNISYHTDIPFLVMHDR